MRRSELLKSLGVPLIVDDLYSLDAAELASLQPLRALIFLFKWLPGAGEPDATGGAYDTSFPGFFAHQVVQNACATLAVLNALGNISDLTMGPELQELFSFTAGMDAQTRGLAITSADWLRAAHNALSPPSAISLDGLELPRTAEDAYHFIVYLPTLGSVYELDGLKQAPINHGLYEEGGEGWVARARYTNLIPCASLSTLTTLRGIIEARIATYPPGSVREPLRFSLAEAHLGFSWNSIYSHSVTIPYRRCAHNSLQHRRPGTASGKLTLPRGLQTSTQNVTVGLCVLYFSPIFFANAFTFRRPSSSRIVFAVTIMLG